MSDLFEKASQNFGVENNDNASVVIYNATSKNQEKYIINSEINQQSLRKFIQDYFSNSLQKVIKSGPLPNNEGNIVKTVVGNNFEELVENSDKHVFLKFYAPWCKHSANLAPVFQELAEKYKN